LGDERRTIRDVYYALESHGYDYDYRQVKCAQEGPSGRIHRPNDYRRYLIELNPLKEFHREFLESSLKMRYASTSMST
jgi:hypothetical protein